MAIPGFICQVCLANVVRVVCREGVSYLTRRYHNQAAHIGHRPLDGSGAIYSTSGITRWVVPYIQAEDLVLDQRAKNLSIFWAPHSACSASFVEFKASGNVRGAGPGNRLDRDGLFHPTSLPRRDRNSDKASHRYGFGSCLRRRTICIRVN
jgi:hypothetical protein